MGHDPSAVYDGKQLIVERGKKMRGLVLNTLGLVLGELVHELGWLNRCHARGDNMGVFGHVKRQYLLSPNTGQVSSRECEEGLGFHEPRPSNERCTRKGYLRLMRARHGTRRRWSRKSLLPAPFLRD